MSRRASILVVEQDDHERARIGDWLEDAGYEVIGCPGPREPDYVCIGGRGKTCPLVAPADVVVLDLFLGSDATMRGTPGWQLLYYYLARYKKVVALVGEGDAVHPLPDAHLAIVERPCSRQRLLAAVEVLMHPMELLFAEYERRISRHARYGNHPAR